MKKTTLRCEDPDCEYWSDNEVPMFTVTVTIEKGLQLSEALVKLTEFDFACAYCAGSVEEVEVEA